MPSYLNLNPGKPLLPTNPSLYPLLLTTVGLVEYVKSTHVKLSVVVIATAGVHPLPNTGTLELPLPFKMNAFSLIVPSLVLVV